jgi:hypothetical protein
VSDNGENGVVDGRPNKSVELLASIKTLREMISGGMAGEPGKTRLETDPDGMAEDVAEFAIFARDLLKANSGPLDWKAIMRVDPVRARDLVDLIDAPIPYIVKPLIVEGSLTQIQGIPKGGKSAFSVYLSFCLATGTWPYPQHFAAVEPVEVLYLAWEDPQIMMAKRLSLYAVGLGHDRKFLPEKLTFLFAPDIFIEQGDHEAALRAAIEELKPKVIFIDTLSHVHRCDENSSSEMKIPMKTLARVAQDCKVGIVYIHHTGKGSSEKLVQDKSRGSGAIAAAWHVLIDWGVREKGSNVNPVEIQSKYESRWKNLAVAYEVQEDEYGNEVAVKWNIETQDTNAKKDPTSGGRRRERILQVFSQAFPKEFLNSEEVTNLSNLGLDERSVRRHLQKMCQDGDLESKYQGPKSPLLYKLCPPKGNLSGVDYQ